MHKIKSFHSNFLRQRREGSFQYEVRTERKFWIFLRKSPFMSRMCSCALLGNCRDSPTLEMHFIVTIADYVLSMYETWLNARL